MAYYLVALGTDRRFNKTRDNVVPYTNVGTNTSITFYDLDLTPGEALYYFSVYAVSKSFSKTLVTSNGFFVGYDGGVAGNLMICYIDISCLCTCRTNNFFLMLQQITICPHFSAGNITSPGPCVDSLSELEVQYEGFTSRLEILMYYIAVSNNTNANDTNCKKYVSFFTIKRNFDLFSKECYLEI